ncbi:diguanylate cyclase [Sphingobium sp.]|uniref:diguanylate cyclase n=1 Tax=Sphingobium sp. TaxID=1912891 RepID=UPI003BB7B3C4
MRLSTITNWAYGATVALTLLSGTTMLLASGAEQRERAAVVQRATFDDLTSTLEEDVYRASEQARGYVVTRDPSHLVAYQREKAAMRSVEDRIRHLRDAGASASELQALQQAIHWADGLTDEQTMALQVARSGDRETARGILFGDEYGREMDRVAAQVSKFQYMLDQRTNHAVEAATDGARLWRSMSEIMLGITAILVLCVLYFVLKQRILHPVVRLSDVVTRLAAQDYDAIPPDLRQVDEIGDMAHAIGIFRENGLERQRLERERDTDRVLRDLLSRMTQRLQGCDNVDDLADVVRRFTPEIVPALAGRLYMLDKRRSVMVQACAWGGPLGSSPDFPTSTCWALRRGQPHRPASDAIDIPCDHLGDHDSLTTICIPLVAQGKSIGLLYLERRSDAPACDLSPFDHYLEMLAENIGLALANLRLRDALHAMAMADALTGLSNRRHFDQALQGHLDRAERNHLPLACLMIDIDHFKRFNDTFGHDAGDAVLRAFAQVLADAVREEQMAFRLGGEEFLLLMPGLTLDQALERAGHVQQRIRDLQVDYRGKPLGSVTASFGLAAYPDHGDTHRLVATADAALLRAKRDGRDRIVVATIRDMPAAISA